MTRIQKKKLHHLNDTEIRTKLKAVLLKRSNPRSRALIVEELGLCEGLSRIDLAVINGKLGGFEIKGDSDDLNRLPGQIQAYSKVFDWVTIVVTERHLEKATSAVPDWWGIACASFRDGEPRIRITRSRKKNPKHDPYAIAQLLWRDEALNLLRHKKLEAGMQSKSRDKIWAKLVESTSSGELRRAVRDQLKSREHWRSV